MNNQVVQHNPFAMGEDEINLGSLLDTIYLDRKRVAAITLLIALSGIGYAFLAKPVYEADLAIQIEDSPTSAKSMLGDVSSLFDTKTAATAEIEILRSRMVVSRAVDNLVLYVKARPKYLPLVGSWLADRSKGLSSPIMGYVWGNEAIQVAAFNVPERLQGLDFTLTADGKGGFELTQDKYDLALNGKVGLPAEYDTALGRIELAVTKLEANAGAAFVLQRNSRLKAIETLQEKLVIAEKGKQSGVIGVKLEGHDPVLTSAILNEVGHEYIRQNVDRKSEEAEKSIAFLNRQLPELKRNLESAESKYNSLRDTRGTIDIGEEGKGLLQQNVATEVKLVEFRQKREEMLARYTPQHPSVANIEAQIGILENQRSAIHAQIRKLPSLEQDVLRLVRDVKVNTELYTSLLNTAQQLNLLKASKVGNARMIDYAAVPEEPIKPKRLMISALAILVGLFAGVATAFIRKAIRGGIDEPKLVEDATGLPVYATIVESKLQKQLARKIAAKEPGRFVLAESHPDDLSIESLRSFRVALQFAMLDASNNRVMTTGPTPDLGKSFISVNLAAVLGQAGKRVLLLDMDLHKGHLNQYFGLGREDGLAELLVGEKTLEQTIKKNVLPNVDFIPAGTRVSNPSALFLNERLPQMLDQVGSQYDIVLVDAPPALLVSDVAVIGTHIGTTFLVVRDSISTMADLHLTLKRLDQARVEVKGVLFNGQLQRVTSSYGYGYKYGNYKQLAAEET
ncbi:MAG: polysaccharide biosynthesis tyrosine autokinase [Sideroxydans sp.]|nr:polysaccharide biosynthesis tyrosine autokinase [Sideroxyarcus sp.]